MTDFGASMAGWIAGLHAGAPALTLLAMFVSALLVTVCAQRVAGDDFAGLGWPVVVGTTAAIT